ncbi:tetratricopeptide repeat protein [Thalassotalea sp. PLHSN55]|uniref:tetratricopeptide repeat protein n=1 Tax=Thalassotalea sp. PLHSN55 TaxID=3435888 RepID=UPI003F8421D5
MKLFNILSLVVLLLLLSACKTTPKFNFEPTTVNSVYLDHEFEGHDEYAVETLDEIFALDEDMQALVDNKLSRIYDERKRASELLEHIFESEQINLQYQGGANLTARQAFHSGEANCMSLTIMAYSLAKAAKLSVTFQDVLVPEYWQRDGEYNMLTGHVNLLIRKRIESNKISLMSEEVLEIDFDPYINKKSFPRRAIGKNKIVAMFYNNKGADALANKDYSVAYRYLKAATLIDPNFSSAWGNLGVLYKHKQLDQHAEYAYHKAININRNNNTALNNLAILLRSQGELDVAEQIELSILRKRINNPYYYALLADEALHRGEPHHALNHYKKAIDLSGRVDEFYFGLAKVHYEMGNYSAAKKSLKKALALNKITQIENQYIAKLNFLKQAEHASYQKL